MIKVRAEFETTAGEATRAAARFRRAHLRARRASLRSNVAFIPNEKLLIKSVSAPYLEPFNAD